MKKDLKALILAAGFGTRLRPITFSVPKCLVEIGDKPLLQNWLETLEGIGCKETLINTHYLSNKVDHFIKNYYSKKMMINTIYEPNLLGTLGTLLKNKLWFKDCTGLLIHGDNFTNANLNLFLEAHYSRPKECLLTMMTFKTSTPESCGIVKLNNNGVMIDFYEKSENPPSDLANGAVYLFDRSFLDWLDRQKFSGNDFSVNVLPLLKGRVQTWLTKNYFFDIGTPEALKKARAIFY